MFQKQMSEDGGPRPARKKASRKEVEGLPEALGRGNRMKASSAPRKPEKVTEKQRSFGGHCGKPIV
jgi:hypothetical protein